MSFQIGTVFPSLYLYWLKVISTTHPELNFRPHKLHNDWNKRMSVFLAPNKVSICSHEFQITLLFLRDDIATPNIKTMIKR